MSHRKLWALALILAWGSPLLAQAESPEIESTQVMPEIELAPQHPQMNYCCGNCEEPFVNLYGGVDFAILNTYIGAPEIDGVGELTNDFDYEFGPRFFVGARGQEGLGLRVSYFFFDAETDPTSADLGNNFLSVEADALDIDVTQIGRIGSWELEFFGGVRYAQLKEAISIPTEGVRVEAALEGAGPTFGVNVRRPLGNGNIALIGNARGAVIFGDTDIVAAPFGSGSVEEHYMTTWDTQIGIEGSYGMFFARAMFETQVWDWAPVVTLIDPDVAFAGPTFTAGARW